MTTIDLTILSDRRERASETATDRTQAASQTTPTNPRRSYPPGRIGQIDRFLATSPAYLATRYAPTLAARHLPPLLALEIQTQAKAKTAPLARNQSFPRFIGDRADPADGPGKPDLGC